MLADDDNDGCNGNFDGMDDKNDQKHTNMSDLQRVGGQCGWHLNDKCWQMMIMTVAMVIMMVMMTK